MTQFVFKHGFWLVLLLALAARLPSLLLEQPNGHDQLEYENIAANLLHGQGFMTDIKIYHAVDTPVRHYAGYDRPILLPVVLAGLRAVVPPRAASRLVGPMLFLIALALIYRAVAAVEGPGAALACGLLLAFQPVLLNATSGPMSEATGVATLAFLIYAYVHRRSPWMTGLACALMFLSRPGSLIAAFIIFCFIAATAIRQRQFKPLLVFCGFALVGPLVQLAFNLVHHAPPFTLPQQWLLHEMHYTDQQHYFHHHPLFKSRGQLLAAEGPWALRTIARQTVAYIQSLLGVKMLIALLPLTAIAALDYTRDRERLCRWMPILLIALANFLFYCTTWSTFDPWRFLVSLLMVLIILTSIGIAHSLPRRGMLLAAVGTICAIWGLFLADAAAHTLADYRKGRTLANMEHQWDAPGRAAAMEHLLAAAGGRPLIVASNQPWAVHWYTGLPVVLLPFDLTEQEIPQFLDHYQADLLVIHHSAWDAKHLKDKQRLITTLGMSQWNIMTLEGDFELWQRSNPIITGSTPPEPRTESTHGTE